MKKLLIISLFVLAAAGLFFLTYPYINTIADRDIPFDEDEPDMSGFLKMKMSKEDYMLLRAENVALLRGLDTAKSDSRPKAIAKLEKSEFELAQKRLEINEPSVAWRSLGPAPIPVSASTSYSGRVSAIAVHPTNPNIVYVGAAQGGVYRTLDGGTTWTPLMDGAQSLAIGSIAVSPSEPTTVFVGTGEAAFSADSFFGVGVYRITNADTSPTLSGPLNLGTGGNDVFSGRSISKIIVHPTNPNILFLSTTSGNGGIAGGSIGFNLPNAGVFRTTNATAASPTFEKLTIQGTLGASRSVVDAAIEPGNPARLLVSVIGSGNDGGVYLSTNALESVPTFTRTLTTGDGSSAGRTELAVNKVGEVITVYAAAGTAGGTLYKSVDGGAAFVQAIANSFCNPQCFYDIAVAVDPNDASKVYLGGSPALIFGRSVNGGTSFTNSSSGLHVDTQAFGISPSNPNIVYFGSDGGIWKTNDVGATPIVWTTLNNTTFSATQFQSIALHPTDRHYTLGGTQDNGTQFFAVDGSTRIRSDGGDGGYTVIDQNAANITNVTAYHTYSNSKGSQIGFARATIGDAATGDPLWGNFYGCGGGVANGISCADDVLFYAPMVNGPGNPNSLYFGTNRLYRSADTGITMIPVSQQLTGGTTSPERVSAIGIAPSNDNVRIIGSTTGRVYISTTAGAITMTDITGAIPARFVARIVIDPNNSNIAYVTLTGYGISSHVWKTTNLLSGTPTWTAAGNGIPDVPTNAFVIDPADSQQLFAGTDIGVFRSTDGGASWQPFSEGLPRVAVFGMEIQRVHRILKIATHGRGVYEISIGGPTFAPNTTKFDFDGDGKADISVFRPTGGNWYLLQSQNGFIGAQFGDTNDKIVPADYDGDGKTDLAVYRAGTWYLLRSQLGFTGFAFGAPDDIPQPADFDGDGKAELAVWRPSNGVGYVYNLATNQVTAAQFGASVDKPVVGDYDGDGKADYAVFRPSAGYWYIAKASGTPAQNFDSIPFGEAQDKPVAADYDGDGKTDVAVFRPSNGTWYLLRSQLGFLGAQFGISTDLPTPADYDGDGKADIAVFRSGTWYLQRSTQGFTGIQFGASTDKPAPNAFIP
ncbi:hypothetical protein BH20ACI1_BH20ACI1_06180 [soil metagenome]